MKNIAIAALALAVTWIGSGALAQELTPEPILPLSNTPSAAYPAWAPLTYAQQVARFESEQRMLRIQWNKWVGYDSLRPSMNASYMSNGSRRYYIPSRGLIVTSGPTRTWYW